MKFGIMFANAGPFGAAEGLVHLAQTAESVGVESLWTVEHVIVPKGYESQVLIRWGDPLFPDAPGSAVAG